MRKLANISTLFAMLLACTAAAWSSTNAFYGGFEDTVGGDYDYNDIVFKVSANNLNLNSAGTLNSAPVLGTSGTPFWNNGSLDTTKANIGYRIYGGGAFGPGLDPNARYLAGPSGESMNDVFFSVGPVASSAGAPIDAAIDLKVSADSNVLGFYYLTTPGTINWLPTVAGSSYSFLDVGGKAFGIAAQDLNTGKVFYSYTAGGTLGTTDGGVNHFAFFPEAPEPASWACMGIGLVLAGVLARRNRSVRVS